MSVPDPCDLHEMDNCAWCKPAPGPGSLARKTGATIEAVYGGSCAMECGRSFSAGESITYSSEADGWCHTACTYDPASAAKDMF